MIKWKNPANRVTYW